jgi:hypothetical protein
MSLWSKVVASWTEQRVSCCYVEFLEMANTVAGRPTLSVEPQEMMDMETTRILL